MKQLFNQTLHSLSALFIISMLISLNTGLAQSDMGWVPVQNNFVEDLWGIYFINDDTGYIAGGFDINYKGGIILRTTDGGLNWSKQTIPVENALYDIYFTDAKNGIAVGAGGTIIRTTNGGETWVEQVSGTENFLWKVRFVDDKKGFAVGGLETSVMLKTTDGGATWDSLSTEGLTPILGGLSFFYGLAFSDTLHGWASAYGGRVIYTSDGGATWKKQRDETGNAVGDIFCLDTNLVWVAATTGSGASVYRTTDGGENWTTHFSTLKNYSNDVFFTDAETGYLVIGVCDGCGTNFPSPDEGGYIFKTTDGGKNWSVQKHVPSTIGLFGVHFFNADNGIVIGAGGTILRTTNGGVPSDIEDIDPMYFSLEQNYPNPFSQSTTIRFTIPGQERVTLKVYDPLGKEVAILVDEELKPGSHEVTWNAQDFPGGIYFYRLETGKYAENRKLILMK